MSLVYTTCTMYINNTIRLNVIEIRLKLIKRTVYTASSMQYTLIL